MKFGETGYILSVMKIEKICRDEDIEKKRGENDLLVEYLESAEADFEKLDSEAVEAYREAVKEVDCRDCGRCCREILVVFDREDAKRLASASGSDEAGFIEKHLFYYKAHDVYLLNSSPCPFQEGNICIYYGERGRACREFPYLETRLFHEVYKYLLQGYFICPVICRVVERIKFVLNITESEGKCSAQV